MYIYGSSYNTCTCVRFVSPLYVTLYVIHSLYTTNIYVSNTYILFSINTYIYVWFRYHLYVRFGSPYKFPLIICNLTCSTDIYIYTHPQYICIYIYIYSILHYFICNVIHIIYIYIYVCVCNLFHHVMSHDYR